jgi:squalene-hopene/tetraprenyl-beta-curcumene cyclase
LACGLPDDHPRVAAARDWLSAHFSAEQAPGAFDESQEHLRKALYFYYCNSAARALAACKVREVGPEKSRVRWAEVLAERLLNLQKSDGSWESEWADMKENDPLIATSLAIGALAQCRAMLP